MLPRIKINFLGGQLGKVGASLDGLVAILIASTAVSKTFELGKSYAISGPSDLARLGVTADNNPELYRHVQAFYREAEAGAELILCGVDASKTMVEICAEGGEAQKLIERHAGAMRAIFISSPAGDSEAVTEGLSPDVFKAIPKAQELAEKATNELYAPLFIVIDGRNYTGENLKSFAEEKHNRVAVLVGDTVKGSKGAALGVLAGRIASKPVQRNIGRVRDGELKQQEFYLGDKLVEERLDQVVELHEKRYISPRRYVGRSGYFFADDNLLAKVSDDYSQIALRRVIDKAYRIAYNTLLDYMLDEIALTEEGKMQAHIAKAWEQNVEDAINREMTANGELSSEDGNGCKCFIDPTQNVVATSKIAISLKVRPFGYARYIDVNLGFLVSGETSKS